jgi:hypothetical protein|eukprot:COSAG01_NODE_6796_length_3494_cov_152.073638_2_plen_67_part_00
MIPELLRLPDLPLPLHHSAAAPLPLRTRTPATGAALHGPKDALSYSRDLQLHLQLHLGKYRNRFLY